MELVHRLALWIMSGMVKQKHDDGDDDMVMMITGDDDDGSHNSAQFYLEENYCYTVVLCVNSFSQTD